MFAPLPLPLSVENRILATVPVDNLVALDPPLEFVELPLRRRIEHPNRSITHAYFPATGLISVVANQAGGKGIEVGIIGAEGMSALPIVLGVDRWPNESVNQIEGTAYRMTVGQLRRLRTDVPSFGVAMELFLYLFLVQSSQTAVANGHGTIEERLARWLLMAHDRISGDDIGLTHEFLSVMLGVRRPGVTVALAALETTGAIARARGTIVVLDREILITASKSFYGVPEREAARLCVG